jgi:hypothetical protein
MPKQRSLSDINIKRKEETVAHKNELIIFNSEDKKNNEHWTEQRSFINKPRPYRCALVGPPNSAKSSIAKNLIVHAKPEYSRVFVIANGSSKEWEEYCDNLITVDQLMDDNILDMFTTDVEGQRILIIDDVELMHCKPKVKEVFAMIFKHISSHYSLTVVVSVQNYTMVPNDIRSNLNVYALSLNIRDVESISILGKKIGISYKEFKLLFTKLKNTVENRQFSYLVIDNTTNSPISISVNFFDKIDLDNIE